LLCAKLRASMVAPETVLHGWDTQTQ
jgi:hypothetical protein